jgi:hypothetical protein
LPVNPMTNLSCQTLIIRPAANFHERELGFKINPLLVVNLPCTSFR